MRHSTVCAGLAVVLMVGCTERASFAQDIPPPSPPQPVAQNCTADRSVEYPAYARTIDILRRSGEIDRASRHFEQARAAVDRVLSARNPGAMAEVDPILDPLFSDKEVRKRATCDFTRYSRDASIVDAWNAWISDSAMRNIHGLVVADPEAAAAKQARVTGSRRELLTRVWVATGQTRFAADRQNSLKRVGEVVAAALDPARSDRPFVEVAPSPQSVDERVVIDQWLAVQLAKVSDDDLKRYLGFAESEAGRAFYRSLRATYTSAMSEWDGWLAVETRTKITPKVLTLGPEAIASHLAQVRGSLDAMGNQNRLSDIKSRLETLARFAPENAEVKTLQGRVELDMLATLEQFRSPYEKKQIRAAASELGTPRMQASDRPEPYLLSAIRLAPENAEARAFLGRVRFLQRRDAEAAASFAEARRLDPDEPNVPFFEADLAYANGDHAKAERSYREALARANARDLNHVLASARLRESLAVLGREREYAAIVKEQIRLHPELWDLRLDYADDLMDRGGASAEALAVLEPIPKTWFNDRRSLVLTRVQVQKVIEAAPSARAAVVDQWDTTFFDTEAVGKALCRAKRLDAADAIFRSPKRPDIGIHIARSMIGCGVLERRPEVVAAALPFFTDIDEPVNGLWQDTALCGAAALGDARTLAVLLKAKADPERRCTGGQTVHQRLLALVAKGDLGAGEALKALEKYSASR
jgi:tetratricopeptide (TPR) repeat protein